MKCIITCYFAFEHTFYFEKHYNQILKSKNSLSDTLSPPPPLSERHILMNPYLLKKLVSAFFSELVLTAPSLSPRAAHCAIAEFFPPEYLFFIPLFIAIVPKMHVLFQTLVLFYCDTGPRFLAQQS